MSIDLYNLVIAAKLTKGGGGGGDIDVDSLTVTENGIYSASTPFIGTFDGNGFEINGIQINVNSLPSGTGDTYVGLFAGNAGTIKNLTVSGSINTGSNFRFIYGIGAIAGYNRGTIEGCCNKAEITVLNGNFVGGLV